MLYGSDRRTKVWLVEKWRYKHIVRVAATKETTGILEKFGRHTGKVPAYNREVRSQKQTHFFCVSIY